MTTSCGCYHREVVAERHTTHGKSNTRENKVWRGIIERCTNPNNHAYPKYSQFGMCDLFRNSFAAFYAEVGDSPGPAYSIDRIDNKRGYEPGNLRWATRKEQGRNKSNNRMMEFRGETRCAAEWCEILALPWAVLKNRIRYGWSADRALRTPYIKLDGRQMPRDAGQRFVSPSR